MRLHILVVAASLGIAAAACGPAQPHNSYTLHGQILSIEAPRKSLTIKHEEIKGLMPGMTMPYEVKDVHLLEGLAPGDLIDATLVVGANDAYLSAVRKVGQAPLAPAPAEAPMPAGSAGLALLQPGDPVPDAAFVDQDGKALRFSAFKGSPLVITFIYTRCPLPAFCPMMDRNFATMQQSLTSDPALERVHLVTVSFDPKTDTPPVLKRHALSLHADFQRWTFLTGDQDEIDRFASRFGVSITRAPNDPRDITHTLRTAIVGADGTLRKVYIGNEWTPAQVLGDLRGAV